MSRCLPYPPPGYVLNPAAVARVEKADKKKREKDKKKAEKRSDRKALQQGETSKHSRHSSKKRKHEFIGTVGQESKTVSKESVEQLEKSGLSDEHGAPCFVQTVRDSPESSQDSSKRRKVVLPSPSKSKNGNILVKMKREQDSPRGVLKKPMVPEQQLIKQMRLGSTQLSKPNSIQQQNKMEVKHSAAAPVNVEPQAIQRQANTRLPSRFTRTQLSKPDSIQQQTKMEVKHAAVAVAAAAPQRVNVEPQAIQIQANTQLPSRFSGEVPQMAKVVQQEDPKLSVKPPVGRSEIQPARVDSPHVKMSQKDVPSKAAPAKVLQKVDPQVSSAEIQRKCPPAFPKVLPEASTVGIRQSENLQPPLVQNLNLEARGMNQLKRPIASVSKEKPSSSGRKAEAVQVQEAKPSKSYLEKRRKAEEEKKFRDLFVTWNPPSFEMEDSDVGAQDWLFSSTRSSDASTASCRASDGSVLFQSMEQQPSLQPRSTFVPGLHILPYVVEW